MDLMQFREELTVKIPNIEGANARPFVCEGSPLDCNVFIVGINPATEIKEDFWCFWDEKEGFLYEKWKKAYDVSGNKKVSQTRKRINIITSTIEKRGIKVLETNIYAFPTKDEKDLKQKSKTDARYKNTSAFEYLMETSKQPFLWVHGKSAIEAFAKLGGKKYENISKITQKDIEENTYNLNKINIHGKNIIFFATNHLSRGFSFEEVEEVAKVILLSFIY